MRISDEELAAKISLRGSGSAFLELFKYAKDLQEARAEILLLGKEVQVYSEYKEAFYKERQIKLERDRYKAAPEGFLRGYGFVGWYSQGGAQR